MLEPELKKYLENINQGLVRLEKWKWWKPFLDGIFRGVGSIIGVVIALILIGWFLNIIGIIPAFQQEVDRWQKLFEETQKQNPLPKTIDLGQ